MTVIGQGVVADAMLTHVKTSDVSTTVYDLRELFANDHVHVALIVDGRRLLRVVDRDDVTADLDDDLAAVHLGVLHERLISADTHLTDAMHRLTGEHRRRLAVVDDAGDLVGLLCLKRSGRGFCSDRDIDDRAAERARACR